MGTITKRNNTYRIRVSCGYDTSGKQIIKSTTWTPAHDMTKRQEEKELERQKVLFEEKCRSGFFIDGTLTLSDFFEKWFKDYAQLHLKPKTINRYKELWTRINQALGHIKLCK